MKAGDTFGDYAVVRLLGRGGMGEVWLLKNAAGVEVAAKILDPETSRDHESRRRFLREAQLALGVKHPNLVEVYDVGEDPETGLCYILMEYVSGGTLADRIRTQGALPIREAVVIVREIAGVLELAREKGIVHRDIKPANIMFAADGTPKLADLGIARGGGSGVETTTVTQTGTMIGTPAYMSPEQMLDAHNVDTRADIYSLGIVFFEMLTGERPNKDDTVVQLMAKALQGEPLPDVRKLRPEVSASVAELLNLMTVKDLGRRISSPKRIVEIAIEIESGSVSLKLEAPKSIAIKKGRPASASPIPSATEPRRGFLPWILLGMVALAFAAIGFLLRPHQSAPPAVQTPESTPVPVIGCDVSSHGNAEIYLSLRRPEIVRQFDEGARVFPLLFKLDERILRKINVLVLHSYSGNAFYDADECRQIENFVKGGGVVVALATCSSSTWGGSGGPVAKWLQSLGASLYNAPNEHHLRAVATCREDAWGRFSDTNATNYALCTSDWKPLVVADADPSKIVSGVRRVGKGAVVFAPAGYLFRVSVSDRSVRIEYPWAEIVPPRITFEPKPDPTFSGSVLSDAPASDTSGRIHLYSSDLSQGELRYLAKLQSAADREIARLFGQEVLTLSRMSNCVVRSQIRPTWYLSGEWLPSRSCFEASTGTPFPSRPNSLPVPEVCAFIRCSLFPRAERNFQGSPVLDYMSSVVAEALATNGYERAFRRNDYPDGRGGSLSGIIAAARRIDPDFSRYDCYGKPWSAEARRLTGRESWELRRGRFFAMMEDIREKHPDICRRYLLALAEGRRGTSERETFDILCELCGNDWPKRWPEPEGQTGTGKAKSVFGHPAARIPDGSYKEVRPEGEWSFVVCDGKLWLGDGDHPALYPQPEGRLQLPESLRGMPVTCVSRWAFRGSRALTELVVPEGYEIIGDGAFYDCASLVRATLPKSLRSIRNCAFCWTKIRSLDMNRIQDWDASAIAGMRFLEEITFDSRNRQFVQKDGCLFDREMKRFLFLPRSRTEVTIPPGIERIEARAFEGCAIRRLVVPKGVRHIGHLACSYCTELRQVILPDGELKIDGQAFEHAEKLTELHFGEGIRHLGERAIFSYCFSLRKLKLPDSLETMETGTFERNASLEEISFGRSLRRIGYRAFGGGMSLKSVRFPAALCEMEAEAFRGCGLLRHVFFDGDAPELLNKRMERGVDIFMDTPRDLTIYVKRGSKGWNPNGDGLPDRWPVGAGGNARRIQYMDDKGVLAETL